MKPSSEHVEQVRQTLLHCVEHYFRETAPQNERVEVDIEPTGKEAYEKESVGRAERGVHTSLRFHLPDGTRREGTFAVSNCGGNVYDVRVRVAGGEERAFQLSVPELEAWGREKMQPSADEMCQHVLLELERTRGKQHLEEATAERPSEKGA